MPTTTNRYGTLQGNWVPLADDAGEITGYAWTMDQSDPERGFAMDPETGEVIISKTPNTPPPRGALNQEGTISREGTGEDFGEGYGWRVLNAKLYEDIPGSAPQSVRAKYEAGTPQTYWDATAYGRKEDFASRLGDYAVPLIAGAVGAGMIAPWAASGYGLGGASSGLVPSAETGLFDAADFAAGGAEGAGGTLEAGYGLGDLPAGVESSIPGPFASGTPDIQVQDILPGQEGYVPTQLPDAAGVSYPEDIGATGYEEAALGLETVGPSALETGTGAVGAGADTVAGAGAGASVGTGPGAAVGAGAGANVLSDVVGGARDVSSVIGAVTGVNTLLGDPLDLHAGEREANETAAGASQASADAIAAQTQIAQKQWDFWKQNYKQNEELLSQQAREAGSPEEFARARGAATADVTGAFDQARKQGLSRMQSYGINPGSPAFQSTAASTDIAEGAARAGALTGADRSTRNLAYSKALDVAGLGRNIPAQSAASYGNAANAATNAANIANVRANSQFLQGQQNIRNLGYGLDAASKWFGSGNRLPNYWSPTGMDYQNTLNSGDQTGWWADGGPVHKRMYTPHMRLFAHGGGVSMRGMEPMDASMMGEMQGPGTETSDDIPAVIDGQEPAALSDGEFVVNAAAVDLTGEEILAAINKAGLEKRGQMPMNSNQVSPEAGMMAYARGGKIARSRYGLGSRYA